MTKRVLSHATVVAFGVLMLYCSLTMVQCAPTIQQWQTRAQATADNTTQARQVILDAVYAGQVITVARTYEVAMKKKPASPVRAAIFGWSAMMAERYASNRQDPILDKMAGRAVDAVKPLVYRRTEAPTLKQYRANLAFRPTKEPLAWLVWAHYLARFAFDGTKEKLDAEQAYKHALLLDPNLAEAYFELAELPFNPDDTPYFKMRQSSLSGLLSTAERLQPKLRPLIVHTRASIAMHTGDYKGAAKDLGEYLALWPTAPMAAESKQLIAQLEKAN